MPDFNKNLKILLSAMEKDHLGKGDFAKYFDVVVKQIQKLKKEMAEAVDSFGKAHQLATNKTKSDHSVNISALKKQMDEAISDLNTKFNGLVQQITNRLEQVRDGKDADSIEIVDKVLKQIPEQKETILDDASQIRDKLETLTEEERLDQSAVRGLEKSLKELREKIAELPTRRGGGGKKITTVRKHDLTDLTDGSTKTFTMPHDTLEVLGVFGTQFPVQFDPGTDWTFAGRTLTLTTAPNTGQTLWVLIQCSFFS